MNVSTGENSILESPRNSTDLIAISNSVIKVKRNERRRDPPGIGGPLVNGGRMSLKKDPSIRRYL